MATSRRNDADSTGTSSLEDALREQMPGWKVVSSSAGTDAMGATGDSEETQQGVDVATLRRKFLGDRTATSAAADAVRGRDAAARGAGQVEVFKIEPAGGGPTQVAERRNGKIRIVSG